MSGGGAFFSFFLDCRFSMGWMEVFDNEVSRVTLSALLQDCCCSVAQSCSTIYDPVNCSIRGFSVLHHLLELAQTHVHWVSDAIQPSCPVSSPSPLAFCFSQHQGLFQWVSSSPQVAKVLEIQHQSFQWVFMVDFLRIDWFAFLAVLGTLECLELSSTPQFESISSLVFSLLYGPTLTSICDYWKNHSFD